MQVKLKTQIIEKYTFSNPLVVKDRMARDIWVGLIAELYELGLSKTTIAKQCQISLPTLKRLEKNLVNPTPATFSKLLAYYCSVATQL